LLQKIAVLPEDDHASSNPAQIPDEVLAFLGLKSYLADVTQSPLIGSSDEKS
jgi:hypothetical protein